MKFMKQDNNNQFKSNSNNFNTSNNPTNFNNSNSSFQRNSQSDVKIDESGRNSLTGNNEERIRQKAYELAEQRGFSAGHELEDWLEAEKLINKN